MSFISSFQFLRTLEKGQSYRIQGSEPWAASNPARMNLEGHSFATPGLQSFILRDVSEVQVLSLMPKCAQSGLCPTGLKVRGGTQTIGLCGLAAVIPHLRKT